MQKFLLRRGFRYEGRCWTGLHIKWMKGLKFEQVLEKETFEQYLSHLEDLTERIKRIEVRTAAAARQPEYPEQARAFRGIDYLTAPALLCGRGGFRRFPHAGAFMPYLGLVPREFSSGRKRNQGGIAKVGNTHIRKLPAESARHYPLPLTAGGNQRTGGRPGGPGGEALT